MNIWQFLEFIWYGLKNNLLDFSKLADIIKKKQPFKISGKFTITTIMEEYTEMSDYLTKLVTPQAQSEHKDITKWGVDVAIDGEAQETRFNLDAFELKAKEGSSVSLKIVAWDNAGNQSENSVEETVVWVDDVKPVVTGNFKIETLKEEFVEDSPAPQPVEEPAPVADEVPATPVEESTNEPEVSETPEVVNEEPAPVVEETQPVEEPAAEPVTEDVPATEEASEPSEEPAAEESATEPEVVETTPVEDTTAPVEEEVQPEVTEGEAIEPATEEASEEITSFPVEGSNEAEKPAE